MEQLFIKGLCLVQSRMYSGTFKIDFPDISELSKYISMRHDLVHRNGMTKEGETVIINKEVLTDLSNKVEVLVHDLSMELKIN